MKRSIYSQSGFTLLEVMIALVIFSIGLLGLAGLQAVSLQNNQSAYTRTMATLLASDMGDRIRNNSGTDYTAATATNKNCTSTTATCSKLDMAQDDRFQWNAEIASSGLTSAVGFISLSGTRYTISIGWDEGRAGNTPTACAPPTGSPASAGIDCVSIIVEP